VGRIIESDEFPDTKLTNNASCWQNTEDLQHPSLQKYDLFIVCSSGIIGFEDVCSVIRFRSYQNERMPG